MKYFFSIILPVIFLITGCSALPTSPDDATNGSFGKENNDFISSIDIITVANPITDKDLDTEILFDIFYSETVSGNIKSIFSEPKKINDTSDITTIRTMRFSFEPQLSNIKIGQLDKFIIKNSGSNSWHYNSIIVIVNKKRILFSVDGKDKLLHKSSTYIVDSDPSKSEHLKIDNLHNPSAVRAAQTTSQNISVITTTANKSSDNINADIYIKFTADSLVPDLVFPDYTCGPTENEYQLYSPGVLFQKGKSDYFTLSSQIIPASFTKIQLTYRAKSEKGSNDWCFSSILALAGGEVIYYKDFASGPVKNNNKIEDYRSLGVNGGKIWIDKFPESVNTSDGFTIAILPDTQGYTIRAYQGLSHGQNSDLGFYRQIAWIVDNIYNSNIRYVTHMGDLIEGYGKRIADWDFNAYAEQWSCARGAMEVLNEVGIPYGIIPGNHDEDSSMVPFEKTFKHYFPISRYRDRPGFVGNLNGMASNAWEFNINGKRYLFLNIEDLGSPVMIFNQFDREKIHKWVKKILQNYRGKNDRVILTTHSFIKTDGSMYNYASEFLEKVLTDTDSRMMNKNGNRIDLILCGHVNGICFLPGSVKKINSGETVNYPPVILSNFQGELGDGFVNTPNAYGNGWMRLLTIHNNDTASISTFSVLDYTNHTMSSKRIELGVVPENQKNTIHNFENFEFNF